MKDKNKPGGFQTFMFFSGFIVLFFFVFALGVIVGKGLNTVDLFHITKKENIEKPTDNSPVTIVNKKEKIKPDAVPVKKTVKKVVTEKKPEPVKKKVVENKPAKKTAETKTVQPEKKKEPLKTKQAVKAEPAKEDKYVAKLDYSKPDFPVTDQGGKYTVQLGSFQNIDAAYNLEKKLLSKGYPCFVIKAAIPKKGTWYRVRVGTFQSKDKAVAYAEKLKNIEKLEYTQVTLNK